MSTKPPDKLAAGSTLRSLCDLCESALKIKAQAWLRCLSFIILSLFCLSSCADKPTPTPPPTEKKDEDSRLIGRIASIQRLDNFVLIQSYGTWKIETGTILATVGPDDRVANLKVTGEKIGQFAAADIQSGTLEIGDSVYTTLTSESIDKEKEPAPETQSETPLDNKETQEEKSQETENGPQ
jgi:hypothetical protein